MRHSLPPSRHRFQEEIDEDRFDSQLRMALCVLLLVGVPAVVMRYAFSIFEGVRQLLELPKPF